MLIRILVFIMSFIFLQSREYRFVPVIVNSDGIYDSGIFAAAIMWREHSGYIVAEMT